MEAIERSPYEAPAAELVKDAELAPDKLFSVEGRIGVLRYNARLLYCILGFLVAAIIMWVCVLTQSTAIMLIGGAVTVAMVVAAFVIMIISGIKRLHDLGFTGWYYLISLIPLAGVIWSLYFSLKPGANESNRFGAWREASKHDKVAGIIGIVAMVSISIISLIPL